jgi:formylmethanofuran dehydrogenase subunit C
MAREFNSRNTPIVSGSLGFQVAPLDIASGGVLLTTLFNVPVNANSAWVQILDTGLNWRLDGNAAGTDWMIMPTLGLIPLSNKSELQRMVLASPLGVVQVAVQFFEGAIGPVPPAPKVPDGSNIPGPPGPPGLISAIPTNNVVHVMKNGNDGTGLRNRLDLPFLTITAASAVLQPGDSLVLWPGTYTEGDLDLANCTLINMGATVTAPNGTASLFVLNNYGDTLTIEGTGIYEHAAGPSDANTLIVCYGSECRVFAQGSEWNQPNGLLFQDYSGDGIAYISGNCTVDASPAYAVAGWERFELRGNVFGGNAASLFSNNRGDHEIIGNVTTARNAFLVERGSMSIYGDLYASMGQSIRCSDGEFCMFGSILSTATDVNLEVVYVEGGSCLIHGNVTSVGTAIHQAGGEVHVYGDLTSSGRHGLHCEAGSAVVYGDCISGGTLQDANGVLCWDGDVTVYGNCAAYTGSAAKLGYVGAAHTGILTVHGNAHSVGRWGAYAVLNTSPLTIHGKVSSSTIEAAYNQEGNLVLNGGAEAIAASKYAVVIQTPGVTTIGAGCYLKSTTTGCINATFAGPVVVRSYGAIANVGVPVTVTFVGVPLVIVP